MSSALLLLILLSMPKKSEEMHHARIVVEKFFEGGWNANGVIGLGPAIFTATYGEFQGASEDEKFKMHMGFSPEELRRASSHHDDDDEYGYNYADEPTHTHTNTPGLTPYRLRTVEEEMALNGPQFTTTHHDFARGEDNYPPGFGKGYIKRRGQPGWITPDGNIIMPDKAGHAGKHWKLYTPDGKTRLADIDPTGKILWPNGPKNKARKP